MNALARKWIDALRSGEYQQGTGRLRGKRVDGSYEFCCLGVLCDISNLGKWGRNGYINNIAYLPRRVADAVLLHGRHRHRVDKCTCVDIELIDKLDDRPVCLSKLNDLGVSFDIIADIVERNSDELFGEVVVNDRTVRQVGKKIRTTKKPSKKVDKKARRKQTTKKPRLP